MSGSFLPSPWSSNNQSLLGSREPALLWNHLSGQDPRRMAYEVTDGSATQTHDWHQRAQNSRQKRRSERADDSRGFRSEEHTSELQSQSNLVCRLLLEKKKKKMLQL